MGDPAQASNEPTWADPRVAYDSLRSEAPVVAIGNAWMVLRHGEVSSAATDPATFSSAVSSHRALPNGLDGREHAVYRAVVDRYLTAKRVADEEPRSRAVAAHLVDGLARGVTVETLAAIGVPFAVRSQSTWLGWPGSLEDELVMWMRDNHAAARSGDRWQTAAVAERFDRIIGGLVEARRDASFEDVTAELMHDTVDGRPLTTEEVVSILRNWTAGDLGSLATSIGVIVHVIATRPTIQRDMRDLVAAKDHVTLEAAVEEILRIDDPFISNRRRTTRQVELGGETIPPGAQVLLNWTAANRDPLVFSDPDRFDPAAHAGANLVFGIGPHRCPGRALTLMELRVITEELLIGTAGIELASDQPAERETPPVGGWSRVPVVLR